MADMLAGGIVAAAAAAVCFEAAYLLQALEGRRVATEVPTRGVLAVLVRRRRWVLGLLLAGAGAVLQIFALHLAPLTVVQPTLALGVVGLVLVGGRVLGEPVAAGDVAAALALATGVALLAVAGDAIDREPVAAGPAAIALTMLGAFLLTALVRRRPRPGLLLAGAGAGDALAALAAARFADALDPVTTLAAVAWLVLAGGAVAGSLSVEMSAVRVWPVTRVGPFVLVCQTVIPVLLAPIVAGEHWTRRAPLVAVGLVFVAAGGWRLAGSAGLLERGEPPEEHVRGPGEVEP